MEQEEILERAWSCLTLKIKSMWKLVLASKLIYGRMMALLKQLSKRSNLSYILSRSLRAALCSSLVSLLLTGGFKRARREERLKQKEEIRKQMSLMKKNKE